MASIRPFRALRPVRDCAAAVSSVPYDVVSTDEARQLASANPLSFLHVTRSEIDLPSGTDPYAQEVYAKARDNFIALQQQARLVMEDGPSLYFYRLRMGAHEQTGIAACFSVDEYKHTDDVDRLCRAVTADAPLYDFRADDGVQHTVWKAGRRESAELVDAFGRIPALYIADGHHRAASAARARGKLGPQAAGSEGDTFIAVAFPDNQAQILPYNRTVKDLAGQSPQQFLAALRSVVPVEEGPATPRAKGEVSMFLDGRWYTLRLSGLRPEDGTRASSLDVALLQHHVLGPLLKVGDIRTDKRIDFVGGARGTAALEQAVKSGSAAVAFSMHPVTIEDLIAISDEGGIMPPKSTWFEPKLRDGLLVHVI